MSSSQAVWKFALEVADLQRVQMPAFAEILTAQMQGDRLCMWALVDPMRPFSDRFIRIMRTGHLVGHERPMRFIATFQLPERGLVFHIFEVLQP